MTLVAWTQLKSEHSFLFHNPAPSTGLFGAPAPSGGGLFGAGKCIQSHLGILPQKIFYVAHVYVFKCISSAHMLHLFDLYQLSPNPGAFW